MTSKMAGPDVTVIARLPSQAAVRESAARGPRMPRGYGRCPRNRRWTRCRRRSHADWAGSVPEPRAGPRLRRGTTARRPQGKGMFRSPHSPYELEADIRDLMFLQIADVPQGVVSVRSPWGRVGWAATMDTAVDPSAATATPWTSPGSTSLLTD